MEKKKSTLAIVLLLIAVLVIGAMAGYIYMQKVETDQKIADLEAQKAEMQSQIDNLQGKIDAISNTINGSEVNSNTNWKKAYIEKINLEKNRESNDLSIRYYIADIDNNEIPELLIENYTAESDRNIDVYTYKENKIISLGNFGTSQIALYKMLDKDYILGVYGHMGDEETYKIYIRENTIKKEILGNRKINPDEGYTEGDVLLEKVDILEKSLIENY